MKISSIPICVLLVISLLCVTSCERVQVDPPIDPLEGIVTESEYAEIQESINNLVEEIELDLLAYSGYQYANEVEYSERLCCLVGYKGLPVLITEMDKRSKDNSQFNNTHFLFSGVYALLRINDMNDYSIDDNAHPRPPKEVVCDIYSNSKKQIPKMLKKVISTDKKIEELREFGILALPYVVKEIEKGNTEYEAYFTTIGLHMETPEFMTYMTDFSMSWEERFEKEGFMDGAEDFDYKVWLSENDEDLDNLFKFLDAYCAEYEAEMAKG